MLDFRLHIFCFLCFINFFLFNIIIINSLLIIIPVVLCLLLSLLPSPSCILIFIINIFHIFYFIWWFSEFRSGKYLCWLLFNVLTLFNDCISTKYNWTWSIWFTRFLRTMRMLWFTIIPWSIPWWLSLSKFRVEIFRSWFSLIFSNLWVLPITHISFSFKKVQIIYLFS